MNKQYQALQDWIDSGNALLNAIDQLHETQKQQIRQLLNRLLEKGKPDNNRLFLLANEGIHPIVDDLKNQYGQDIRFEVVTRGNVALDEEAQIAKRVKAIVDANHGAEFVIVPSGLPYIITVVYNTILQITSKHPVYLQLDRDSGRYIEKTLDPRKLMF